MGVAKAGKEMGLITSVLITPDGKTVEAEAAHGKESKVRQGELLSTMWQEHRREAAWAVF